MFKVLAIAGLLSLTACAHDDGFSKSMSIAVSKCTGHAVNTNSGCK